MIGNLDRELLRHGRVHAGAAAALLIAALIVVAIVIVFRRSLELEEPDHA